MTQEQVIEAIELKRQQEVCAIALCPNTKCWQYYLRGDNKAYYFDDKS